MEELVAVLLSSSGRNSSGLDSIGPDSHGDRNSDDVGRDLSDPGDIALGKRCGVGNGSEKGRAGDDSEGLHFDNDDKSGLKE